MVANRKARQKGLDIGCAPVSRVALQIRLNVTADPEEVGLLGAKAHPPGPHGIAGGGEEAGPGSNIPAGGEWDVMQRGSLLSPSKTGSSGRSQMFIHLIRPETSRHFRRLING